ncbi:MAG: hypothetical protein WCE75_14490, partial [Terracidiphilus sp.]
LRGAAWAALILAVAAAAQLALYGYLYGKPSLNGERPPYLMARVIADGPGLWYLHAHCGGGEWAVCGYMEKLNDDPDHFLWDEEGAYISATPEESTRMRREEMPLVRAAVMAYPRAQLARSRDNFWNQLHAFGLYGFDPSAFIEGEFQTVLPGERGQFLASRQARTALPLDELTDFQWWVVVVSLAAVAGLIPLLWRRRNPCIVPLGLTVAFAIVANAAVTGVLSVVDDRYGCRVIWLAPLAVLLGVADWLTQGGSWRLRKRDAARAGVR